MQGQMQGQQGGFRSGLAHLDSSAFAAEEAEAEAEAAQQQGQPQSGPEVESNLFCWGRSQDGQAGPASCEMADGTLVVPGPTRVRFPVGVGGAVRQSVRIVAVSCGSRHTLALDDQVGGWVCGVCLDVVGWKGMRRVVFGGGVGRSYTHTSIQPQTKTQTNPTHTVHPLLVGLGPAGPTRAG